MGRGIHEALTGAVGGDEVLEREQALAEVCLNGQVDGVTGHIGHEAAHAGELTKLRLGATGAGVGHHVDGVVLSEALKHLGAELVGALGPSVNDLDVTLPLGEEAVLVVLVDLVDLVLRLVEHLLLLGRDDGIPDRNRKARDGGVVEARLLDGVENGLDIGGAVAVTRVVDEVLDVALVHLVVDEGVVRRQAARVEDHAADGGLDAHRVIGDVVVHGAVPLVEGAENPATVLDHIGVLRPHANLDVCLDVQVVAVVEGENCVVEVGKDAALALGAVLGRGEEVRTEDHVLRRHGDNLAGGGLAQVVGREHEDARLGLRLRGERHVNRHLVAIEVGVEGGAHQRVQVDGLALNEDRLEGLDGEAVQRRSAVEEHQAILDDLVEHIPNGGHAAIDGALGTLDVLNLAQLDQATHHEGLEELERHGRGQAALVQLEVRVDDDDRTAGVVDALAQQVLAEAALLALEGLGKRLQRTSATAGDGTATAAVVEECVNRLLEHALLVVDDDRGRIEVKQALESVVTVDHATVEVVQVRRGKAAAVELHHGAQVGRDHGDDVQDHVGRVVATLEEGVDDLQALDGLLALLLLRVIGGDDGAKLGGLLLEVNATEQLAHGLGAHAALEVDAVVALELGEERLVGDELALLELHELLVGLAAKRLLFLVLLLEVGDAGTDLLLGEGLDVVELVSRGLALLLQALDLVVALGVQLLEVCSQLLLEVVGIGLAGLGVDVSDDVAREVENLFQVLALHVEQARHGEACGALEVPDVAYGSGELDVAHALAAHLGRGHLDAAALADDALEADALVLAAGALPVLDGTEDLLAEQAVLLRLERAVVDRLGLLDLAVRPAANLVCRGKRDLDSVEVGGIEFCHSRYSLSLLASPTRSSDSPRSRARPLTRSSVVLMLAKTSTGFSLAAAFFSSSGLGSAFFL